MATKTDNSDPEAKLELRRYFLRKYHAAEPPRVILAKEIEAVLWRALRKEFLLASYWGIDLKKQKGRLCLDSVLVLRQRGWSEEVIDVDTYGSPWKHWEALLPNVWQPTTVFLTIGVVRAGGGGGLDRLAAKALGLGTLPVPQGISCKLHEVASTYLLTKSYDYGITLIEAVEAVSAGNARYVGVRLEPARADGQDRSAAGG